MDNGKETGQALTAAAYWRESSQERSLNETNKLSDCAMAQQSCHQSFICKSVLPMQAPREASSKQENHPSAHSISNHVSIPCCFHHLTTSPSCEVPADNAWVGILQKDRVLGNTNGGVEVRIGQNMDQSSPANSVSKGDRETVRINGDSGIAETLTHTYHIHVEVSSVFIS